MLFAAAWNKSAVSAHENDSTETLQIQLISWRHRQRKLLGSVFSGDFFLRIRSHGIKSPFFLTTIWEKKFWILFHPHRRVANLSFFFVVLKKQTTQQERKHPALRILTPPMEIPDPPNDTPGAGKKQVVLTPHDIPWSLRVENSF